MGHGTNVSNTGARPSTAEPKPPVEDWNGSVTPADHGAASATVAPPPTVPGKSGSGAGTTAVNTPSMTLFASNMDALIKPLDEARTQLGGINVRAGAFHQGFELADKLNVEVRSSFDVVLRKLIETVTDVRDGARKLAVDYETTEEAARADADDLNNAMPDLGAWKPPAMGAGPNGPTVPATGGDLDALRDAGSDLGN